MSNIVRKAGILDKGLYKLQSQSNFSLGTATRASSGLIVAYGKFAGFPRFDLVITKN